EGLSGMANNGTVKAEGFLAFLVQDAQVSTGKYALAAMLLALAIVLQKVLYPEIDAREPPPMKPKIPIIGHLVGIIQHQSQYLKVLENRNAAIATLPILNGKIYAVWDPFLIQAVYRNRNLSFEPYAVEFAYKSLGFSKETNKLLQEQGHSLVPEFFEGIQVGMGSKYVHRMNTNALSYVATMLENMSQGSESFQAANFFVWVRDLMTVATTEALYGPGNPFKNHPNLLEDAWIYERDLTKVMIGIFPSITARECFYARKRVQTALGQYYESKLDLHEDAAQVVKNRAAVLRKYGITGEQVGIFEISMLHVSTANTIPALFWFIMHVFTRPNLVSRLREEVLPVAQHGGDGQVTIEIGSLDERCPLLFSCYREAIRVSNRAVGNRRVMEDTTISDGNGNTYFLKKGCDLQLSAQVEHSLEKAWGPNALAFLPERFLEKGIKENTEQERLKRASYVPFGGGKSLCPGRHFAFAETLGFVTSLLLGFEVAVLDEGGNVTNKMPEAAGCSLSTSVQKPVNNGEGFGVRIQRRQGWGKVTWRYNS
ncbi:25-hydroxycholesterol 7-alpha-hydroxylase 3, partial [Colletotrichum chlorophyti]